MATIGETRMVNLAKGKPVEANIKLQLSSRPADRDVFVLNSGVIGGDFGTFMLQLADR
jgi:hypothetical protein